MHVCLVQHGTAKSVIDAGRRDVERVAEFLARLRLGLDRVEHSEKHRARQTAEILSVPLRPPGGTHEVAGLAPDDDVEPVFDRLQLGSKNLMLVGHLLVSAIWFRGCSASI
jgi:phosphohistidine phosphatase SixA